MALDASVILTQIGDVIAKCEQVLPHIQLRTDLIPLAKHTVDRFARPQSSFHQTAEIGFKYIGRDSATALSLILSALRSLKLAYENGYLATLETQINTELLSDFIAQAESLLDLDPKFKDAAAVLAGGVLEEHLRKLCDQNNIATTYEQHDRTKPKSLDAMNSDLAKHSVYDKNEQKQVTAWAGIRNNAAHAEYDKYQTDQVVLMVQGVRAFLNRHPA